MAVVIVDGSDKCQTLFLCPCPVCGAVFNQGEGVFVRSATLGELVLVCRGHKGQKDLTSEQEICVQESLDRAMKNPKGWVQKIQRVFKKSAVMAEHGVT